MSQLEPSARRTHKVDRSAAARPTKKNVQEERKFLEGPRHVHDEFVRFLRIGREFVKGFWHLRSLGPTVTVFGSARFKEDHRYYQLAREIGAAIGREGFSVMTGGGPGIMEAANRGAREAGAKTIGCNIVLPEEQAPNPYIDKILTFRYFFVRKVMLIKYSQAFVIMPGGFGTLDEAYEAATLIQTKKILDFPLIFVGVDFWQPLFDFMHQRLLTAKTITEDDFERLTLTDSVDQVVECLYGCLGHPKKKVDKKTAAT